MLWYLMKTWIGGEEALVKEVRRGIPPYMYEDVFVIYNERIWRRQGQSIIWTEPLFKGCVFLTCRETEALFRRMDRIPAMSRLMAAGYLTMLPLMERDAHFLERLSGPEHILRASYVLREAEGSSIYHVSGPLEYLLDDIERIKFRSRTVKTRRRLWGEDQVIALGIIAREDRTVRYGETDVTVEWPADGQYSLLEIEKDAEGKNVYRRGERVTALPEIAIMSTVPMPKSPENGKAGTERISVAV